ncbi:hypothetical protein [Jatrophihabitans sp.]|uniref:hypothetical protein n=1 Tax=Jatrophihabitans sp. TaxID=1932789 RepID=UPI0030C730AF|nr:hypothetical protein [Jatrophihabitans sp.]
MTEQTTEGRPSALSNLDPTQGFIVSAFGRKGSGKTTFNRRLFRQYPFAKLCIDVNGEADPGPEVEHPGRYERGRVTKIHELEDRMPPPREWGGPKLYPALHYVADPGSVTYREDLDRAIGMGMNPSDAPSMVWAGEVNEFCTESASPPHMRRLLQQSRHWRVSALFDGPRPKKIDSLIIMQSDLVAIYDLPNPADRMRVAETIAFKPADFDEECEETFSRGPYWFLLWDARAKQLYRYPPLPADGA